MPVRVHLIEPDADCARALRASAARAMRRAHPHADTLALLRQSALLLLPSYTENAPLVALEALVAGVPVIGYAVGGLPDIVRDDETGLLAPLLDMLG